MNIAGKFCYIPLLLFGVCCPSLCQIPGAHSFPPTVDFKGPIKSIAEDGGSVSVLKTDGWTMQVAGEAPQYDEVVSTVKVRLIGLNQSQPIPLRVKLFLQQKLRGHVVRVETFRESKPSVQEDYEVEGKIFLPGEKRSINHQAVLMIRKISR